MAKARTLPSFGILPMTLALLALTSAGLKLAVHAQSGAVDPGVRGGPAGAGQFIPGLTNPQLAVAVRGQQDFNAINTVQGPDPGLGPRYDAIHCTTCHVQPAFGGSGGFNNGLFQDYQVDGAFNYMPFFEIFTGPTLNARFPRQLSNPSLPDGGVHQLFTIAGRADAGGCDLAQPDFSTASSENDLTFRAPLPMFGDGLVEIIPESDILANQAVECAAEATTGICGVPNDAPDGTIARFGWKAQQRSMLLFSGEAYQVEQGVSNAQFPDELDESAGCVLNAVPEDHFNFSGVSRPLDFPGAPERFAIFARLLAPPTPAPGNSSTVNGELQFKRIGCDICHTTSFVTPRSAISALSGVRANLFSDLLLHHMGPCLADGITEGSAAGDMFRTPPLWGVGQRVFFLHDGRTLDIVQAVEDHFCTGDGSYPDSEANTVIDRFNSLTTPNQQDLINFLRSL